MEKRPRIAVVGSVNIDLTTFTDRFPKPGETCFGQKFDLGFGGKGANQAVAAHLCGAEVFMVARVGSDLFGPATIENFMKRGIDTTYVKQVEGVSTGVAPIFVEPSGQNRILVVKGANDTLRPADVDAAAERKADPSIAGLAEHPGECQIGDLSPVRQIVEAEQRHRLGAEDLHAVERAAAQHHPAEPHVVVCCGNQAPAAGFHWGMATFHPTLPRGARVRTEVRGSLKEILLGPAHENDGRMNLFGALKTAMATCGYETLKEFQKAEVMVAPALQTEGKQLQRSQGVGMGH